MSASSLSLEKYFRDILDKSTGTIDEWIRLGPSEGKINYTFSRKFYDLNWKLKYIFLHSWDYIFPIQAKHDMETIILSISYNICRILLKVPMCRKSFTQKATKHQWQTHCSHINFSGWMASQNICVCFLMLWVEALELRCRKWLYCRV